MSKDSFTDAKEHFPSEAYGVVAGVSVTADGTGVVPLAGAVAVRLLADRVGLTDGMAAALSQGLIASPVGYCP